MRQGDMDAVHALAEDALLLARERGDTPAVVRALTKLTNVAVSRGNVDEAVAIAEQADDPRSAVNGLNALGLVELARGRPVAAREAFERALVMVAEQDRRPDTVATLKYNVALASVLAGQPEAAEALLEEAIATYRALGDAEGVAYCFVASAAIHAGRDEPSRAGELLYAAELLLAEVAASLEPAEQELFASTLARVESELGPDELSGARERAWELANAELTLMTGEGLTRPRPVASARLPAPKGG